MSAIKDNVQCPYCNSKFTFFNNERNSFFDWGVAACECDEFPIVDGILLTLKNDALLNRQIVALVKSRKYALAVWRSLSYSGRNYRLFFFLLWLFSYANKWKVLIREELVYRTLSRFGRRRMWFKYLLKRTRWRDLYYGLKVIKNEMSSLPKTGTCLDVGCGTGTSTAQLMQIFPEYSFVGIDKDFESLLLFRIYRRKCFRNVFLLCSNIEYGFPVRINCISIVTSFAILPWVYSKSRFFSEVKRVLFSGGYALVTDIGKKEITYGYGINKRQILDLIQDDWCKVKFLKDRNDFKSKGDQIRSYGLFMQKDKIIL